MADELLFQNLKVLDVGSWITAPMNASSSPQNTAGAGLGERALYWSSGGVRAVRLGHWKLHTQYVPAKVWLYDLAIDPTEQINPLRLQPEARLNRAAKRLSSRIDRG